MTDRQRVEQLERELAAAVEHHERYTRAIDKALGEPRDLTDGWLLEQHLAAINRLKAKPAHRLAQCVGNLPPDAQAEFWNLLMTMILGRSRAETWPETYLSRLRELADLFAKNGMEFEMYT